MGFLDSFNQFMQGIGRVVDALDEDIVDLHERARQQRIAENDRFKDCPRGEQTGPCYQNFVSMDEEQETEYIYSQDSAYLFDRTDDFE